MELILGFVIGFVFFPALIALRMFGPAIAAELRDRRGR